MGKTEGRLQSHKDVVMAKLIEVEDELHNMDKVLEQFAGHGHASGDFIGLNNVFNVIQNNSHESFPKNRRKACRRFLILCRDGKCYRRNGRIF